MRTNHPPLLSVCVACALVAAQAFSQTRSSANYSVITETRDAGGRRATSANYTNSGSLGGIAGVSTVVSPSETAKQGYIAQLYEVTALNITASPTTVNEGQTRQLSGAQLLDDSTTINVPANSITWSIVSGPIASINSGGLATAAAVYQNTAASVQGSYAGNAGNLGLTVLNVSTDDYGTYGTDGIADEWQVQFFGEPPNANAAPTVDADYDGRDNRFEFFSGYSPVNPLEFFVFSFDSKVGNTATLRLSKVIVGTTYALQKNTSELSPGGWSTIQTLNPSSESLNVLVQDTAASGARVFYRVNLTRP